MNRRNAVCLILLLTAASSMVVSVRGQSTSQEYPTPVSANEVSGTIKARDIGDPRLTTYYYLIQGEQGDLFLNLVTRNFAGDIDLFTFTGLRPLAKIVVLGDLGESETGRAIYLRRPEKLLLRVQGRTPNDEPATYRFKFGGSFAVMKPEDALGQPDIPRLSSETRGTVRVTSSGAVIPLAPEPAKAGAEQQPAKLEAVSEPEKNESPKLRDLDSVKAQIPSEKKTETSKEANQDVTLPKVVISDPLGDDARSVEPNAPAEAKEPRPISIGARRAAISAGGQKVPLRISERKAPIQKVVSGNDADAVAVEEVKRSAAGSSDPGERMAPNPIDPLASITLVIELKNGSIVEKTMREVRSFSVTEGVLVVILSDGKTSRYPMTEVARVRIENLPRN